MLIKLTGRKTGRPVLVESGAILTAEELNDPFDDEPYTALALVAESVRASLGVKETCAEICELIADGEDGLL